MASQPPDPTASDDAAASPLPAPGPDLGALDLRLLDLDIPAAVVDVDPDEADLLGAFEETALSEADALASAIDADWEVDHG